jgi:hypothetical protein
LAANALAVERSWCLALLAVISKKLQAALTMLRRPYCLVLLAVILMVTLLAHKIKNLFVFYGITAP